MLFKHFEMNVYLSLLFHFSIIVTIVIKKLRFYCATHAIRVIINFNDYSVSERTRYVVIATQNNAKISYNA